MSFWWTYRSYYDLMSYNSDCKPFKKKKTKSSVSVLDVALLYYVKKGNVKDWSMPMFFKHKQNTIFCIT